MRIASVISLVGLIFSLPYTVPGQSTFQFQNRHSTYGIDSPVFGAQGVPLAGADYLAELYGGPISNSLIPATAFGARVMVPFLTGSGAGYFIGPSVLISTVPSGGWAWLQVRAWDARLGATYEEVASRGLGGYGESAPFYAQGGNTGLLVPPQPLIGLQSFSLRGVIPEPSASLLLLLGLPLLFWRGRAK